VLSIVTPGNDSIVPVVKSVTVRLKLCVSATAMPS